MCFSDSSKYISSLMRFPWQLNLFSPDFDKKVLPLVTNVSFDPTSWAIRLTSSILLGYIYIL